jgi:hypothetical protein
MRKALIYLILVFSSVAVSAQQADSLAMQDSVAAPAGRLIQMDGVFLQPLQERDSVLIADQVLYGFELKQVEEGTRFAFPEWKGDERGGVQALSPWIVDTVKTKKQKKGMPRLLDIRSSLLLTSFDEGVYDLPPIMVGRLSNDGILDTLVFDPMRLEVKTMPVDTATFVPHDIKGQIRYPLTFAEVFPWLAAFWVFAVVVIVASCLVIIHKRKSDPAYVRKDPAHIVALRELDKYRGSKMWAADKQKTFYSGVTDALREYISSRYGVSAMEMTTAEIFADMKDSDVPKELLSEVQELFERADFVKFAKYVASDDDNASVLSLAVRFVTETYKTEVEEENKNGGAE